ncbi:AMP-binding protein [Candidatus Margulisiibacteriota bacterium]
MIEQKTLTDKLKHIARQYPNDVIMQIKEEKEYVRYTYKDFFETSKAVACWLIKNGFKKGKRAAIVMGNCPQWGMIYFGILFSGGIAVPFDPKSSADDTKYILEHSEAGIVFASAETLPLLTEAVSGFETPPVIVTLDTDDHNSGYIPLIDIISLPQSLMAHAALPSISANDTASILYTSGTTGRPKGVMLSHNNFNSNFRSIDHLNICSPVDNVLSILPLHHSYPFMVTLIVPLFSRVRITYLKSLKSEELLQCMRETGVTILVGVPQLFQLFHKNIMEKISHIPLAARLPLLGTLKILLLIKQTFHINPARILLGPVHHKFGRKLRLLVSGGAKLNTKVNRDLSSLGFNIIEGYGLTETAPVVSFNTLEHTHIGSVGKPVPHCYARIGQPDEHGHGEILISGSNVMQGYFKSTQDTNTVMIDGWFHTGDTGYFDKHGYLYITGRVKETIVLSSGKNITPDEIESYYSKIPFIKEMCILGIGADESEYLGAVIVPDMEYYRHNKEIEVFDTLCANIKNFSRLLPAYQRILRFIIAREELPRTRLGKLQRFAVRKQYIDQLQGRQIKPRPLSNEENKLLNSPTGQKLTAVLTACSPLKPDSISPADHIELDLGLTSLDRVELALALEQAFKIDIKDTEMAQIFTAKELIEKIEEIISTQGLTTTKTALDTDNVWPALLTREPPDKLIDKIDLTPCPCNILLTGAVTGLFRILFKLFWKLKISGIENIPPAGPFVLCPNHGSFLDGPIVSAALPSHLKKDLFFLGTTAFFEDTWLRRLVKWMRVIPVDQAVHLVEAMQACAYVLNRGKTACIFPGGGRATSPEVREFRKGIGILAKELNIPLIPVYINGSYESWPAPNPFPKPHPLTITFGQPCTAEELQKEGEELGIKDPYKAISKALRERVVELSR